MSLYQKLNKILIILVTTILLLSCNNSDNKNELLIDKDVFIKVLTDINLADATLSYMQPNKAWKGISAESYYPSVLKKNNVTREQFEFTVGYYTDIPKEYDEIYEEVISNLSKMQGDIHDEKLKAQESEKKD